MRQYYNLLLLGAIFFLSCSKDNDDVVFPLLGKWKVNETTLDTISIPNVFSTKEFQIEFLNNRIAFYEQGRIKDTFDFRYYPTDSLFHLIRKSSDPIKSAQFFKILENNSNTALCIGDYEQIDIKWDMTKI